MNTFTWLGGAREKETYKPIGRCYLWSFANFIHRLALGRAYEVLHLLGSGVALCTASMCMGCTPLGWVVMHSDYSRASTQRRPPVLLWACFHCSLYKWFAGTQAPESGTEQPSCGHLLSLGVWSQETLKQPGEVCVTAWPRFVDSYQVLVPCKSPLIQCHFCPKL